MQVQYHVRITYQLAVMRDICQAGGEGAARQFWLCKALSEMEDIILFYSGGSEPEIEVALGYLLMGEGVSGIGTH